MFYNCLHLTFVLLSCGANVSMAIDLVVSEQRYDWQTAMNERPCAILKEKTYHRITTDFNMMKSVQITYMGNPPTYFEAWTGRYDYYKPEIKFSGSCYKIPSVNLDKPTYLFNNILTDCYKRCQNDSFYVEKIMCVCKTDVNTQPKHKCNVKSCDTIGNCGYPIPISRNSSYLYCMCLYDFKEYVSAYWIPPGYAALEKQCVKVTYNFINRTFTEKEHRCTERLPLLCEETTSQTTLQISDTATRHSGTDKVTPPTTSPRTSEAASTKSMYKLTSSTELSTARHNTNIRTSSQAEVTFKDVSARYDGERTGAITINPGGRNTHPDTNNIPVFGGIGGGLFFIVCLIFTICVFMWKKRSNRTRQPKEVELSLDIGDSDNDDHNRGPDVDVYTEIDIKDSDNVLHRAGGKIECLNVSNQACISKLTSTQTALSDNYVFNVLNEKYEELDVEDISPPSLYNRTTLTLANEQAQGSLYTGLIREDIAHASLYSDPKPEVAQPPLYSHSIPTLEKDDVEKGSLYTGLIRDDIAPSSVYSDLKQKVDSPNRHCDEYQNMGSEYQNVSSMT